MDLKQYVKEARNYYSKCGICPTQEEIYNYIANEISNEHGLDYDFAFSVVEKELGSLEN